MAYFKAVVFFGFLVFVGCSATQEIQIGLDGQGSGTLEIVMNHALVSYLEDVQSMAGISKDKASVFDVKKAEKTLAASGDLEVTKLESPEKGRLLVGFTFKDPSKAAEGLSSSILGFQSDGKTSTIRLTLDKTKAMGLLTTMMGASKDDWFGSMFGGYSDLDLTAKELSEPLIEILAPYLDSDEAAVKAVNGASIKVTVVPKGEIVSQKNGKIVDGKVVFELTTLELFTIEEPVVYEITFKK